MSQSRSEKATREKPQPIAPLYRDADMEPDWTDTCMACGQSPIVPATGLCGPCTFGDSETAGGNW